jgi:hypothetical protein
MPSFNNKGDQMNTTKLADISEIVSSIAIVITLVFLTIQMHHNTQAIEATSRQGALDADSNFLNQIISNPDLFLSITSPEPTEEGLVRHFASLILFFRGLENDWAQYQQGVMDEATWERYKISISSYMAYERNRNWWMNYGVLRFDPQFVAVVNDLIQEAPLRHGQIPDLIRSYFESPEE